jgi:hypothetical protein
MSPAVGLWLGGALLSLFFAWILGHMQRTDARARTERVLGLSERALSALVPGEVNAARGTLVADPLLTCPVDGASCVLYELTVTREGSRRGTPKPPETAQREERYADAALDAGAAQVKLALSGARLPASTAEVTRLATWRDDEWTDDTWEAGGWLPEERRYVESLGPALRGELDAGAVELRYRRLPAGDEVLAIGELLNAREPTLGSSARFQLELTGGTLSEYQRAQRDALRAMQRSSRAFVALAAALGLLAGLTYAGVLP